MPARRPLRPLLADHPDLQTSRVHADVRLPADSVHLEGKLDLPPAVKGLVIFAQGSRRHSIRNRYVAGMLHNMGIGTLLLDLLTQEEEASDEATHELRFDIPLLAGRLMAVTHWALQQSQTHALPLGYCGASTGSAAALVAAARMGSKIAAVVSRGGRLDLADAALPAVRSPTLLIVGEVDHLLPDLNERAFNRLSCDKQLHVIPGATQRFEEPGQLEQVAQVSASWFHYRLVRQAVP